MLPVFHKLTLPELQKALGRYGRIDETGELQGDALLARMSILAKMLIFPKIMSSKMGSFSCDFCIICGIVFAFFSKFSKVKMLNFG